MSAAVRLLLDNWRDVFMRRTRHQPFLPVPAPKGLRRGAGGGSPLSPSVLVIVVDFDFLLLPGPKVGIWPSLIGHLFQRSSTFMTPGTSAPVSIQGLMTRGRAEAAMLVPGSGRGCRWNFARSPATHLLRGNLAPNRPQSGTGGRGLLAVTYFTLLTTLIISNVDT